MSEVAEVLEERPELETPLRDVLAVDERHDAWTFDDIPIGSGAFGELVSRGLIENTADGDAYRVANPDAVRAVLEARASGDATAATETSPAAALSTERTTPDLSSLRVRLADVDGNTLVSLLGALCLVVLARAYVYGQVFRDGVVVLSSNDPYYYRYWVEQALAASGGALDVSGLATIPNAVATGEPLLVATLWGLASLFGGDPTAAGWVLAWYPVVAAVITAYLVYRLTMVVTDDRRVALAALVLLAVTPAHALRTSLGFADHHAFDYVWLMLTAYATVRLGALADAGWREPGQWAWAGVLAVGLAGQVLAWEAGPLMILPLGLYVVVRVLQDVRLGHSPVTANAPLVGGLSLGALVVYLVHTQVGWHTATVASAPALLAVGVLVVLGAGELAYRFEVSARVLAGVDILGGSLGLVVIRTLRPADWAQVMDGITRITAERNIAETQSLVTGDTFGWLFLFGFILVLILPFLIWESIEAYRGARGWLVPVVYGWYFLVLTMYSVRFAGQLALFASVFAGLGFVYLAAAVDLTGKPVSLSEEREPRAHVSMPSPGAMGQFFVLFVLVAGLSVVQVPLKTNQITTESEMYDTAAWIAEDLEDAPADRPSYVFSPWSHNRMYNYFANGDSRSYGYARTNYRTFLASANETTWYDRLRGRTGYVVYHDVQAPAGSLAERLDAYGSRTGNATGLAHYRAVHVSESGAYRVFTLVPGATLAGSADPNATVTVTTTVEVSGVRIDYERRVRTDATGNYSVTVPYPGTYDAAGTDTAVSEAAVLNGTRVVA